MGFFPLRFLVRNNVYFLCFPACFSSFALLCNPGCDFHAFLLYFSPPPPLPCVGYMWASFIHFDCVATWFLTDHTSVSSLFALCSPLRFLIVPLSHTVSSRYNLPASLMRFHCVPQYVVHAFFVGPPTLLIPKVSCTIHFVFCA